MQRCDGVMASGHSVDTFAIPALQPLVLNLFVRPGREDSELETQREVVLSMLIRVIDHSRVLPLLTHVLDCFSRSTEHWLRVRSLHQLCYPPLMVSNAGFWPDPGLSAQCCGKTFSCS